MQLVAGSKNSQAMTIEPPLMIQPNSQPLVVGPGATLTLALKLLIVRAVAETPRLTWAAAVSGVVSPTGARK